jgi:type II secretory pathway pseudopilin PulG
MKLHFSQNRTSGMTLFEVGVAIALVMILAVLLLPWLATSRRRASRISCAYNLKQVGLCYRIWAGDNSDTYPMGISVTNGGSMETVLTGNVVHTFLVMSNELSTPKILVCTEDSAHFATNLFSDLTNTNISYFVGIDVTNDLNPNLIISGDANFEIGGMPVKSGLSEMSSGPPVRWSATRHITYGYIGLADGSVQSANNSSLTNWFQRTGLATNRLAIP